MLAWSFEPLILMINLWLSITWRVYYAVPPIRWAWTAFSRLVQIFLCVQLTFWGVTVIRLIWSLVCVCLCFMVDIVEDQADRASMGAVVRRIYL